MKKPLVDHLWTKIAERGSLAESAIQQKLDELTDIETAIRTQDGAEAVRNVLGNGTIRRALERCRDYHNGSSDVSELDLSIFFNYATATAKDSERIIDAELSYLNL